MIYLFEWSGASSEQNSKGWRPIENIHLQAPLTVLFGMAKKHRWKNRLFLEKKTMVSSVFVFENSGFIQGTVKTKSASEHSLWILACFFNLYGFDLCASLHLWGKAWTKDLRNSLK